MQLRFIGSGDAFGSGGRLNTCFQVVGESVNFLIDCGASSLIGLKRHRVALNDIRAVFVTHFHADHFGGIPFFMLDAQFFSKRTQPFCIAGPPGLGKWYHRVMETTFPGSSRTKPKFELSLIELNPGERCRVADVSVTPFQVSHGEQNGPSFAYRWEAEGRVIAYSGDTEWTDALIEAGRETDLFIAEAYFFEKKVKFHLDLESLAARRALVKPKRLVLTHMSDDMLVRIPHLEFEAAYDGKVIDI